MTKTVRTGFGPTTVSVQERDVFQGIFHRSEHWVERNGKLLFRCATKTDARNAAWDLNQAVKSLKPAPVQVKKPTTPEQDKMDLFGG